MSSNSNKALALAGAMIVLGACGGEKAHKPAAGTSKAPQSVRTAAVKAVDWPEETEVTGTIRARVSTTVASKVPGYIREIRVSAGDRVAAGQVLVTLDARDLDIARREAEARVTEAGSAVGETEQGIASAKAQFGLAQATHRRMTDLFEKKSISNQEFDESQARVRVAEAAYESALSRKKQVEARIAQAREGLSAAQAQRSYAEITAPFAGTVVERKAEQGTLAAPGMPILLIEQAGAMRAELSVGESQAGRIRIGTLVRLEVEPDARVIETKISEIVPVVDAASRMLTVKAELPVSAMVRSGTFVRGRFVLGQRRVITVPAALVRQEGQLHSVLVVDGRVARERLVTTGSLREGQLEILSGLLEGDLLISPRPAGLSDGEPVEAAR